jgi:Flp pilus assembly pilin Flp
MKSLLTQLLRNEEVMEYALIGAAIILAVSAIVDQLSLAAVHHYRSVLQAMQSFRSVGL